MNETLHQQSVNQRSRDSVPGSLCMAMWSLGSRSALSSAQHIWHSIVNQNTKYLGATARPWQIWAKQVFIKLNSWIYDILLRFESQTNQQALSPPFFLPVSAVSPESYGFKHLLHLLEYQSPATLHSVQRPTPTATNVCHLQETISHSARHLLHFTVMSVPTGTLGKTGTRTLKLLVRLVFKQQLYLRLRG